MNYLTWWAIFMFVPLIFLTGGVMYYRSEIIRNNYDVISRSMVSIVIIGYMWDAYAVHEGWWYYEPHQIINIWFLGLPLEEHVFIISTSLFYVILTLIALESWNGDEK